MSERKRSLERKIKTAFSLTKLIKTMKVLSAINVSSYEKAVKSLYHYYRSIDLGLIVCLNQFPDLLQAVERDKKIKKRIGIVIFGSDQGMVGQFNDEITKYALTEINALSGEKIIWSVGERAYSRIKGQVDLELKTPLNVPNSIMNIMPLVSQILDAFEKEREEGIDQFLVFHNKTIPGAYFTPTRKYLLPIDRDWLSHFTEKKWPTKMLPEIIDGVDITFPFLIKEHLFASIFKACAESLASENASRLASMQVAEKHIEELLDGLQKKFNKERQNSIDEEIFDLISGYEAIISR